jgi:hypothetical protein
MRTTRPDCDSVCYAAIQSVDISRIAAISMVASIQSLVIGLLPA